MKIKYILLSLLFLLTLTVNGQKKYAKQWSQVQNDELDGKTTTASKKADKIFLLAKKENNPQQFIKAFLYKAKFSLLLEEDSHIKIYNALQLEIKQADFPIRNVLESILANSLEEYLNDNSYKLRKRTMVDSISEDYRTWDIKTLHSQIHKHYQNSLATPEKLIKIPDSDFYELIHIGDNHKKLRATLFDILANRALGYYSTGNSYAGKKNSTTPLSEYYDLSKDFITKKLQKTDPSFSEKTFAIFQQLEKLHIQKGDTLSVVLATLDRYDYIKEKNNIDTLDTYLKALKKLEKHYASGTANDFINLTLARHFYQNMNLNQYSDYNSKALHIAEQILKKTKDTYLKNQAEKLIKIIKKSSLLVKTEKFIVPNTKSKALVRYKNIKQLHLLFYKVPLAYPSFGIRYYDADSLTTDFKQKHTPVKKVTYTLPENFYYIDQSTEIILPELTAGRYLIIAQKELRTDIANSVYGITDIQVTSLVITSATLENKREYRITDRQYGTPIKNAEILFNNINNDSISIKQVSTNTKGIATISKKKKSLDFDVIIAKGNDSLLVKNSLQQKYKSHKSPKKNEEDIEIKSSIFTDRAIYRPGQKIYFKGIITQLKNNKSSTVVGEYILVTLYNTNDDEVKALRLKTNKFGSVHGEFTIPLTGLNGRFTIEMEEDDEIDSKFWDDTGGFYNYNCHIQVEEYKRPKFEIQFDEITEQYTFNDSIQIKGIAKAFLGSSISDAVVKYTIKRDENYYFTNDSEEITITGETMTDQNGTFIIPFVAIADTNSTPEDKHKYTYLISVEITDINGETRTKETSIKVNYHSLTAAIYIPNVLQSTTSENALNITTYTLNGYQTPTKGKVSIYKVHGPKRILRERPWPLPDTQQIPAQQFIKLFPNDSYSKEEVAYTQGTSLTTEYLVNTEESNRLLLGDLKKWKSGKYIAKFHTTDINGYDIMAEKTFYLSHPHQNYLPDNQLFKMEWNSSLLASENKLFLDLRTASESLFVYIDIYQRNQLVYSDLVEIKDGRYRIPFTPKNQDDKIDVQVTYTKYNCQWTKKIGYSFPEIVENSDLNIQLETFRNKLEPGKKETWKLKILNHDRTPANAEVLASMYDMSLDEFKPLDWQHLIKANPYKKRHTYNKMAIVDTQSSFDTMDIWFRNIKKINYHTTSFTYNSLNFFGYGFYQSQQTHQNYLRNISYTYGSQISNSKGKRLKAPGGTITGIVLDEEGLPLIGATVIIKGTNQGTTTDFDGLFTIHADKDDILEFSYIGYISVQTKIKNNEAEIMMREDASSLSEVVVVGYGMQKKRSVTGAVTRIKTMNISNETIEKKLNGIVCGISIIKNFTKPNVVYTLKIKGFNTIKDKSKVLVVVNGKPILKGSHTIHMNDLIALQVLKGTAAKKLYGSKAANGAVIITTKKEVEELQKVVPRKNLKETAFFFPQLRTDKKGNISFEFEAPEALTRWKFQALAHDQQANAAVFQNQVITQKEISITPNLPRFLREGDTLTISAKVTNLSNTTKSGTALLELTNEISQESLQTIIIDQKIKSFKASANAGTTVSWKIYIPSDIQAIRYKIIAISNQLSDGEESILPVLSNTMLVTESIPIWLRAGEQQTYAFNKLKNQISTTQKTHKITLEYTTNPTWLAIKSLPYIIEYPYECAEQTFSRYYGNKIAHHILTSNPIIKEVVDSWKNNRQLISNLEKNQELKNIILQESPWVRNAISEKEQQARIATLFDAATLLGKQEVTIKRLRDMQLPSGGFPWFSGGHANPYITRYIIAGFGHLKQLHITSEHTSSIRTIIKKAITYLDNTFIQNYKIRQLKDGAYSFSSRDLHYFYARSFWKDIYPIPSEHTHIYKQFIAHEKQDWLQYTLYNKTLLALVAHRNNNTLLAAKIIESLKENAVFSKENGMYWKENTAGWYWYQSPIETQALIIEAFSEITQGTTIIDELKIWLLKNKKTHSWNTTKATTEAIYALLLQGGDWLSIQDEVDISFGDTIKENNTLKIDTQEAGIGYFKKQWDTTTITKNMASITIQNKSEGPQYGGYYWQYFENLDHISKPDEHAIGIKKRIFLKQQTSTGSLLKEVTNKNTLQMGHLVTIRIELNVKNDFEFVHMKDMRASGLEPTNTISQYKWQDGLGYYESTKDASTNFFFDRLPKGVYVFEYTLRVNNQGDFSNGITTIQSMYAPEFSSHSKGVRIKID